MPGTTLSDARRQAALERDLAEPQRRHRRFARRLQHDRAARGERRRDAARADLNRVVPRDDLRRHADRLAHGVVEEPGPERDRVAHDLVGDAGEELEVARRDLDVGARLPQRLAVVAALERGQLLDPIAKRLRDADHDAAALGRRRCRPRPSIRAPRAPPARRDRRRPSSPSRRSRARSPVDGSKTSNVPPSDASTRSPSMMSCSVMHCDRRHRSAPRRRSSPDRVQRRAVVRSVDLRLDQARSVDTRAPRRARASSSASVVGHARASRRSSRRAPASRSRQARRRPASSRRACCLISIRLSDASLNTMAMMRSFSRTAVSSSPGAHQQPAVAGQRDHRPLAIERAPRQSPPAAQTPSSTGRWR